MQHVLFLRRAWLGCISPAIHKRGLFCSLQPSWSLLIYITLCKGEGLNFFSYILFLSTCVLQESMVRVRESLPSWVDPERASAVNLLKVCRPFKLFPRISLCLESTQLPRLTVLHWISIGQKNHVTEWIPRVQHDRFPISDWNWQPTCFEPCSLALTWIWSNFLQIWWACARPGVYSVFAFVIIVSYPDQASKSVSHSFIGEGRYLGSFCTQLTVWNRISTISCEENQSIPTGMSFLLSIRRRYIAPPPSHTHPSLHTCNCCASQGIAAQWNGTSKYKYLNCPSPRFPQLPHVFWRYFVIMFLLVSSPVL